MQENNIENTSIAQLCTSMNVPGSSREIQSDRDGSVRVHSGSGFRFVVPFPWRLHQILDDMDKAGDTSIISWQPDGRHFQRVAHDRVGLTSIVAHNSGAYYHDKFVRGNRKLSLEITRIKAPPRRRISSKGSQKIKSLSFPKMSMAKEETMMPLSRDTTQWLINAGVPFAALDPYPVNSRRAGKNSKHSSIYDCAEDITSVFNENESTNGLSPQPIAVKETSSPFGIDFVSSQFFDFDAADFN
eukprot:scaffold9308_cov115-Cylindrotheca_fusiformis.AAC.20